MEFKFYGVLILIVVFIYEKVWRKRVCNKKIKAQILAWGGEIRYIEKLSPREEIYQVEYVINEVKKTNTVKFGFFYNERWY